MMIADDFRYGKVVSTRLPFEGALTRARELLKDEGFGVLSEIDVTMTLKENRGLDFPAYRILGACNPDFAYQALITEKQLGLLLPCNLVVTVDHGKTLVSAVDAVAMLGIVDNPNLSKIAADVNRRLHRVLERIAE